MAQYNGTFGNDTLYGGDGNNYLYGENGDDILYGGGGNDYLDGGNGTDLLYGGTSEDTLHGGAGDDEIYGDYGNDVLHGDGGIDTLTGGNGTDKFVFTLLDNYDVITDFDASESDKIVIDSSSTGISSINDLTYSYSSMLNIGVIYFNEQQIIQLNDASAFALDSQNFEFI